MSKKLKYILFSLIYSLFIYKLLLFLINSHESIPCIEYFKNNSFEIFYDRMKFKIGAILFSIICLCISYYLLWRIKNILFKVVGLIIPIIICVCISIIYLKNKKTKNSTFPENFPLLCERIIPNDMFHRGHEVRALSFKEYKNYRELGGFIHITDLSFDINYVFAYEAISGESHFKISYKVPPDFDIKKIDEETEFKIEKRQAKLSKDYNYIEVVHVIDIL